MPGNKKKSKKKGYRKPLQTAGKPTNEHQESSSASDINDSMLKKTNLDDAILLEEVVVLDGQGNNNDNSSGKKTLFGNILSEFNECDEIQNSYSKSIEGDNVKYKRDFSDFVNNNEAGMKNRNTPELKSAKMVPKSSMKEDLMTIEDFLNLGISREIVMMKHPLANKWVFWWFRNDKSKAWEQSQEKIATVDTIEDFWQVYNYIEPASNLSQGCDYSVFKKGIQPDWEDFQNMAGGRWIVTSDRTKRDELVDDYWLETLFILIGEHAGDYADMVNGAVINIRNKGDKLAMWLKDANNMNAVMQIGRLIKSKLKLRDRINFTVHREANSKGTRSRYGSQNSPSKIFI